MLPSSQASPLCPHLDLAGLSSEPHDLSPEEEQAAVLAAEVGIEGLEGLGGRETHTRVTAECLPQGPASTA